MLVRVDMLIQRQAFDPAVLFLLVRVECPCSTSRPEYPLGCLNRVVIAVAEGPFLPPRHTIFFPPCMTTICGSSLGIFIQMNHTKIDAATTRLLFIYCCLAIHISFLVFALLYYCVRMPRTKTGAGSPGPSPCATAVTSRTTGTRETTLARSLYPVPNKTPYDNRITEHLSQSPTASRKPLDGSLPVRLETGRSTQ